MISLPSRVRITRSTHHLYVELLNCDPTEHRAALDFLKERGARWQPHAKRWELSATPQRHEVLYRFLDLYAAPNCITWQAQEGR